MLSLNNSDSSSSLIYHVKTRNLKEARIEIDHENILRSHKLINAVRKGNKKTVQEVLKFEKEQEQPGLTSCLEEVTFRGNTALHIAATYGHMEIAMILCNEDRNLLTAQNRKGDTALHCAAGAGDTNMVHFLIEFCREELPCFIELPHQDQGDSEMKEILRAKNADGETALHKAVQSGHVNVVKELMLANPGLAGEVNGDHASPLYLAAASGDAKMVETIIQFLPVEDVSEAVYIGPEGRNALHATVVTALQNKETMTNLLKWNPQLAKGIDKWGRTPLHYATAFGVFDSVQLLLNHDPSMVYISDASGLFPLHIAASTGDLQIIIRLLQESPDYDELLDSEGKNFLHISIEHKRVLVARYVCENPCFSRILNAQDDKGNTPLHIAVKNEYEKIVIVLIGNPAVKTNLVNKDGLTALDLATIHDHTFPYLLAPETIIRVCLLWVGAIRSHAGVDKFTCHEKVVVDAKMKSNKYESDTQKLSIGSVLVASTTFTAVFTLPRPTESTVQKAFKAFIIADSIAFFTKNALKYTTTDIVRATRKRSVQKRQENSQLGTSCKLNYQDKIKFQMFIYLLQKSYLILNKKEQSARA
ncbi:Ankyrin repeat protein family-like protein [Rhynchospora pubera]|uniref:Ankyrin repeat protein family-like protein n=1 Tax=Rhynchospora pubera TaxID=906938 RepID=A0AAV8D8R0_9POAL|nr:Ankyrin repeat protein family-like protein [Rhynchospora pubera]